MLWEKRNRSKILLSSAYLSAKKVKVLGRCGGVHDLDIDIITVYACLAAVTPLQEALNAARGMLGPSTVHTVGQQHHQARLQQPLVCSEGNNCLAS